MTVELKTISIEQITFGERFRDEYGDLDTLAASLKKEGIIQPLAVRACTGGDEYILLAGGRRYKACLQAGSELLRSNRHPAGIVRRHLD